MKQTITNLLKTKTEPLLALAAITLTLVLLGTRNTQMSDATATMIVGFFVVALLAWGTFIFKERPADEREAELSLVASKYAYLVGAAVMSVGIIVETMNHDLGPWLPIALSSMVVAKSLAYFVKK